MDVKIVENSRVRDKEREIRCGNAFTRVINLTRWGG